MRIAIDCRMHSTKFTGIGKYVDQLITNLAKIDTQNEYILYFNDPEFTEFKPPAPNFRKYLVNAPHYSLKEQTKFALAIKQTKPDLVHFTHFNSPIPTIRKQVTTIHDLTLHFYPGRKYVSKLKRFAYKSVLLASLLKSKKIITVSKNTEKDLHKLYPFTKKKTRTIYEGVDENFINPTIKTKLSFDLPKNYILYTGNWRDHKNLVNLIIAFHILKKDYDYKGKLVLTGNENELYPETREKIQEYKLENDVITPGLIPEDELPTLYTKADCYVFPSLYEGFGLPILESFATETPVACSNKSCLPEIGSDGVLTFNPLDTQEMALQINKILTDKQTRDRLIKNGTKRLKDFSFEKMARETLKLYNELLSKS